STPPRTVTVCGRLVGGPIREGREGERRRDPVVHFGRIFLPAGKQCYPVVRGFAVDPAPAAGRVELRRPAGHRRTAAAAGAAIPPEGPRSDDGLGAAGVDR